MHNRLFIPTLLLFLFCLTGCSSPAPTAPPTPIAPTTTGNSVPTVTLNWARADAESLRIDVTVRGLEPSANVEDAICDPYIAIRQDVRHGPAGREQVNRLSDPTGNPLEITYLYSLDYTTRPGSLDIQMDLTLGPCANSFNFDESNVTPTVMALIGNYHFDFTVPVQ